MLPLAQAVEDGHHIMPPVDTRRERPATPGAAVDPATKVESTAERAKRYRRERNLATAEADKLHGRLVELLRRRSNSVSRSALPPTPPTRPRCPPHNLNELCSTIAPMEALEATQVCLGT